MQYPNLPGIQASTTDGMLRAVSTPVAKSTVVVGTAGDGPADTIYGPVTDPSAAGLLFGYDGNLIRGLEEVMVYSDHVYLFRMGTAPATLKGVGAQTGAGAVAGFDITFNGDRSANAGTNYKVYYSDGVLYVFKSGSLVWANDLVGGQVVDVNDVTVTGAAGADSGFALGSAPTWAGAVALTAISGLTDADVVTPLPIFTPAVTGLGLNNRQTYVAQAKALDLLTMSPVQQVYCPGAILNAPNVAFNASTADPNTLDWLKSWSSMTDGHMIYHWASEVNDSDGSPVVPHGVWASSLDRIGAGYREVNFGYQLACFAARMSEAQPSDGGTIAFLGCSAPKSFNLLDLRAWIGRSPVFDAGTGACTAAGSGLLGSPYLAGTSAAALHTLCADKASTVGRAPGFFENDADSYDGGSAYDRNNMPINIGAHLHIMADWGYLKTGYGTYTGGVAGLTAGFHATLDPKSSLLNKQVVGVTQVYHPTLAQLDALTALGINMLKYDGNGNPPRLTHGFTAAKVPAVKGVALSDFDRLTRQDIKFLCIQTAASVAKPFLGESSPDGMALQALQTALDKAMSDLKQRGYINWYDFKITASAADQKLGNANLFLTIRPASELVKLFINTALAPFSAVTA